MIRKLLATTAIATLVATGAYAQTAPAPAPMEQQTEAQMKHAEGHLASNIIGQTVYSSSGDDAENIGSVTDLVIKPDGQIEAIVVGVGGFLGLGRKDVALEYNVAEWVERDGNEWLVIPTNREALEALPEFDTAAFEPQSASAEVGNTTPATGQDLGVAAAPAAGDATTAPAPSAPVADGGTPPASDSMAAAPAAPAAPADGTSATTNDTAAAPAPAADDNADMGTDATETAAIDRSTLTDVDTASMSADDFIGTTVYGANDENVGEISDVLMSQDGKVDGVVIDVGGFLGMGEKSVVVGMDNLAFLSDADGNNYLYTPFTQEQLEAQPEYDESTFAANRDSQLLIVPAQ